MCWNGTKDVSAFVFYRIRKFVLSIADTSGMKTSGLYSRNLQRSKRFTRVVKPRKWKGHNIRLSKVPCTTSCPIDSISILTRAPNQSILLLCPIRHVSLFFHANSVKAWQPICSLARSTVYQLLVRNEQHWILGQLRPGLIKALQYHGAVQALSSGQAALLSWCIQLR